MKIEDGPLGSAYPACHRLDERAKLLVRDIARRVPRRRVCKTCAHHLMLVIDHHDTALRHLDVRALFQHFDNLQLIIIARVDKASYTTPTQPLLGNATPALHAL